MFAFSALETHLTEAAGIAILTAKRAGRRASTRCAVSNAVSTICRGWQGCSWALRESRHGALGSGADPGEGDPHRKLLTAAEVRSLKPRLFPDTWEPVR